MAIKHALISVSDKAGIIDFARTLTTLGIGITSSGGTAKALQKAGIPCRELSELTGFPEILDGRVKTLNPKVHGGILARRDKPGHMAELKKHGIEPIDIVVVNLYPFEETISALKPGSTDLTDDVIENIDIGGVALLRASAKNFSDVLIVCDPNDYTALAENIRKNDLPVSLRRDLAAKAFRHTAYYDALISGYFTTEKFPSQMAIPLSRINSLRYGENPHQKAAVYRRGAPSASPSLVAAEQLQGKELSYNNYLDLEAAWRLAGEFNDPVCAIIKHNNPCGCAVGKTILEAYAKALVCDPASAFGGIIAFNRAVDGATAAEVVKLFTECIIAPSYTPEALTVFAAKKNLRLLTLPNAPETALPEVEYRTLSGGMLVQDKDTALLNEIKPATKRQPSSAESDSLLFAWKLCKHVKSNAIILVRGTQTVGIGAGQMSRIDSLNIAAEKMKAVAHGLPEKDNPLVLASDAFFPFNDVVLASARIGVTAIAQPGGSMRDADSITAADENSIAMVFTGMRHFKH